MLPRLQPLLPLLIALLVSSLVSCRAAWSDLFSKVQCPPKDFNAVDNFNITAYAAAPWYPQKQIPLIYQTKDDLYCVQAQYKLINASDPLAGVYVYNSARRGKVDGELMGNTDDGKFALQAIPDEKADKASKLQVGPKALSFIQSVAYGPYWIVAVGPSTNTTIKYDWAVVSGGPPTYKSGSACSTFAPLLPTTWQYRGGLWLFTRKAVDPTNAAAAEAAAKGLGFDTTQLQNVTQKGCTYPPLR